MKEYQIGAESFGAGAAVGIAMVGIQLRFLVYDGGKLNQLHHREYQNYHPNIFYS